ncbi:MAG: MucR family transcriptional regulator [Candidatus Rokuibacteriota bacterium]
MPRRTRTPSAELEYYRANLDAVWREDGVVCLECGGVYKGLLSHVRWKHELEGDDYRAKWGFNRQAVFVSPDYEEKLRRVAIRRGLPEAGTRMLMAALRTRRPRIPGPMRLQGRRHLSESRTKAHEEDVLALARRGLTGKEVARHLGVSRLTAGRHLRALRARDLLPPPAPLSPRFARILALARQGLWQSEIAERLGLRVNNVASALSKLRARGVEVSTPAGPRPNSRRKLGDTEFVELIRQGMTDTEIAARFALRRETVISKRCHLRKRGLLPRLALPRP